MDMQSKSSLARRLLVNGSDPGREGLREYQTRGGYGALRGEIECSDPKRVLKCLTDAGLHGKGGANFPTATKWRMVYSEPSPRFVVCNGGEHEPGSRKDIVLMTMYPHAVLEGVLIAARTVDAERAYIYITEDQTTAIESMRRAIEEANGAGLMADVCDVQCVAGPATYVSGEETAAINAIEGNEAKPRAKPPYPTAAGLWGRPTLVDNVETLANIAPILRCGPAWFRSMGTSGSPGSVLITLSNGVNRPGVYEIPYGMTIREIVASCGQGTIDDRAIKAVLPGGPSLPFLDGTQVDTVFDHESLKAAGSSPGCAAIRVWLEGECMVEASLQIAEFFAQEQCGQCPACRMETNTIAMALRQLSSGSGGRKSLQQIEKVTQYAQGKGKCSLLNMAAAPVLSAMRLFEGDFNQHIQRRSCSDRAVVNAAANQEV